MAWTTAYLVSPDAVIRMPDMVEHSEYISDHWQTFRPSLKSPPVDDHRFVSEIYQSWSRVRYTPPGLVFLSLPQMTTSWLRRLQEVLLEHNFKAEIVGVNPGATTHNLIKFPWREFLGFESIADLKRPERMASRRERIAATVIMGSLKTKPIEVFLSQTGLNFSDILAVVSIPYPTLDRPEKSSRRFYLVVRGDHGTMDLFQFAWSPLEPMIIDGKIRDAFHPPHAVDHLLSHIKGYRGVGRSIIQQLMKRGVFEGEVDYRPNETIPEDFYA